MTYIAPIISISELPSIVPNASLQSDLNDIYSTFNALAGDSGLVINLANPAGSVQGSLHKLVLDTNVANAYSLYHLNVAINTTEYKNKLSLEGLNAFNFYYNTAVRNTTLSIQTLQEVAVLLAKIESKPNMLFDEFRDLISKIKQKLNQVETYYKKLTLCYVKYEKNKIEPTYRITTTKTDEILAATKIADGLRDMDFNSMDFMSKCHYVAKYYKLGTIAVADKGTDNYIYVLPEDRNIGFPCIYYPPNVPSKAHIENFYVGYMTDMLGPTTAFTSLISIKGKALKAQLRTKTDFSQSLSLLLDFANKGISALNSVVGLSDKLWEAIPVITHNYVHYIGRNQPREFLEYKDKKYIIGEYGAPYIWKSASDDRNQVFPLMTTELLSVDKLRLARLQAAVYSPPLGLGSSVTVPPGLQPYGGAGWTPAVPAVSEPATFVEEIIVNDVPVQIFSCGGHLFGKIVGSQTNYNFNKAFPYVESSDTLAYIKQPNKGFGKLTQADPSSYVESISLSKSNSSLEQYNENPSTIGSRGGSTSTDKDGYWAQFFAGAGGDVGTPSGQDRAAWSDQISNYVDSINSGVQMNNTDVQSFNNKQNMLDSLVSSYNKTMEQSRQKILQNIR